MPTRSFWLVPFLLLALAGPGQADLIVETAKVGSLTEDGGSAIYSGNWLGARFQLTDTVHFDKIGARVGPSATVGDNRLFLAVAALSAPDGFPQPNSASFAELAVVTFAIPTGPSDVLVTVDFSLPAGDYALILGSGRFGVSGQGTLIQNNTTFLTTSIQLDGSPSWHGGSSSLAYRFLGEGTVVAVPEPSVVALVATVAGFSIIRGRRRLLPLLRRSSASKLWKRRS